MTTGRDLLLKHLKPINYHVRLEPDFQKEKFYGHVKIFCTVLEATDAVHLHCKLINVSAAAVECNGNGWDLTKSMSYYESAETVELKFGTTLPVHEEAIIILEYTGRFKSDLTGFYHAHYTNEDGTACDFAATSMEPTYARQVFPCFDEPDLRAKFKISVVVDSSFSCVSNMPLEQSTEIVDGKCLFEFQESVPMSTYLVGLVAGPMSRVQSSTCRVPLSIYCPLGRESEADFSLEIACQGLQLFEDLFDSPYPLPKLDLVAVPDFSTGAMENWGVIMFRMTALLLNPGDSSLDRKQDVTQCVLHEVSHMWFGNLVTMKYWDCLWLKEGFATYFAWLAADRIFPQWHIWDSYVTNTLQSALQLDALEGNHPVELVVRNATRAKQMFDDISYKKGCCVIEMLSSDLGQEKLISGIRLYLQRHEFGSTVSEHLWAALEEASGDRIAQKMRTWTKEAGFPVITVKEELTTNRQGQRQVSAIRLSQQRFFASGQNYSRHVTHYPLRISIRSESGVNTYELNGQETVIQANGRRIMKVNADHHGFYRTSYSPSHLRKLTEAAIENQLSVRDCVGLVADMITLMTAGQNRTSDLLDLCLGFNKAQGIWKFHSEILLRALRNATIDVVGTKARELGWNITDDDDETVIFKASMFSSAGLAGDRSILEMAKASFAERINGNEKAIPPSLRWEVFGIVAKYGCREDIEAMFNIWKTSSNEDEKYLALECLGRANTPELVQWILSHAFTTDVKDQDIYLLIWLAGSSSHGASELWEWTKLNWQKLETAVPVDMQVLILGVVLDGLSTIEKQQDVKKYFSSRNTTNYDQVLTQKLEDMKIRSCCAERDLDDVTAWLKTHGYWPE